jgi:hypothetical protein
MRLHPALGLLLVLGGCASVIDGTDQDIAVSTSPAAADCGLYRQGVLIARVPSTPGTVRLRKSLDDISVVCVKPGYQPATYLDKSGTNGTTWGNIAAGGLIGYVVDHSNGASSKYASPVDLTLLPQGLGTGAYPSQLPPTFVMPTLPTS